MIMKCWEYWDYVGRSGGWAALILFRIWYAEERVSGFTGDILLEFDMIPPLFYITCQIVRIELR